jgi:hypothetical protein
MRIFVGIYPFYSIVSNNFVNMEFTVVFSTDDLWFSILINIGAGVNTSGIPMNRMAIRV